MLNASKVEKLSSERWAEHEFAEVELPDKRLKGRLMTIARDLANRPSLSIPRACGSWNRTKAAYRFFDHDNVSGPMLLTGHYQASLERMRSQPVVLTVQDTTTLNYAGHGAAQGLGPTNRRANSGLGMLLHGTLAFTPAHLPLGVLQANMWSRDPKAHGGNRQRNQKPLADKESYRWLQSFELSCQLAAELKDTQVVNVADREGDLYEVFAAALRADAAAVLVRAQHNRQVLEGRAPLLWEHIAAHDVAAVNDIEVPQRGAEPARRARCEIRFGPVALAAPTLKDDQPPLRGIWFVEVREVGFPQKKAVVWRVLTTLAVTTLEQAMEKVRWYLVRWQIEVFHRTLKTGCTVEGLQLDSAKKLRLAIVVKMIVAWRIMALVQCSRTAPEGPASALLAPEEIAVLITMSKIKTPAAALTLRQAVHAIAGLGGFLGRRSDGEPGVLTLWHGLQRLTDMTAAVNAVKNCG